VDNPTSKRVSSGSGGEEEGSERRGRRVPISRRMFFFGEEDVEGEATLLDLSTNGCQATSLTMPQLGATLKLSLFLEDQQWPLRIDEAVVRWVKEQKFGLEFTGIRPAQRERLRALIMKEK